MKKRTFTLLLILLQLVSVNLLAQNQEGLFHLKEGDWFEIQVEQNDGASFLLNYQLEKQLPNKNQLYKIRLDHYKLKRKFGNNYFGYDSYYPIFEENKTDPDIKNQFSLEVTPTGKIVQLIPFKNNKSPKIYLTEIGSSYRAMASVSYSDQMADSMLIKYTSAVFMHPDSKSNKILASTESRVPLFIKLTDKQIFITDASFPLPNNAIIRGKVNDQKNIKINISLLGENSEYYFPEKTFKSNLDGSFNCPIFLKRPFHLRIQIDDKFLTTFMEPGDTLNISLIGHQTREIQYNQYAETKQNEYFSADLKKTDYFSGSAAYNTMLSNELDQYRSGYSEEKEVQAVIINREKVTQKVLQLIDNYRGKASDKCIEYFQSDFKYFLGAAKLYFREAQQISYFKYFQNGLFPKTDYPADFFLDVDTMAVLMNTFEWNSSYQNFIRRSQQFKQNRLGWSVGKFYTENFPENYFFTQASLKGYPFYSQIAKSIDSELRKGLANNNIVTHYYQDFMNNCADPALTEPLGKVYKTALQLEIGNQFPISSFVLQDSSAFNLKKFKGKPICLIMVSGPKSSIKEYMEEISKYTKDEVEFVFVRSTGGNWIEWRIDSIIMKKPAVTYSELDSTILKRHNVTYIELSEKYLKSKLLLGRNKIFMLDKWFRIVENNAEDPMTHKYKRGVSEFEKSLRKTIETKRFSKSEKTAMVKTAGWSFGSILFTAFVGWWIYRIRIRRIRKLEAVKRRIKELEIKAIRSQMNPHFIFNALNSIQSLINGNQFKEANIYLSKFAVLLRGVLNNSEKGMVSLSDELKAVELYCQLEQLRFEFRFDINIDPEINCDLIEIPGMIIQPLAENAIVHGLSSKGNQGKLNINLARQNGNLSICVSDNGAGLSPQITDTLSQKGFGLKLVEERITILNLDGKLAKLTVKNRNNQPGTIATLTIPID